MYILLYMMAIFIILRETHLYKDGDYVMMIGELSQILHKDGRVISDSSRGWKSYLRFFTRMEELSQILHEDGRFFTRMEELSQILHEDGRVILRHLPHMIISSTDGEVIRTGDVS
jgi:hypothetical protein